MFLVCLAGFVRTGFPAQPRIVAHITEEALSLKLWICCQPPWLANIQAMSVSGRQSSFKQHAPQACCTLTCDTS